MDLKLVELTRDNFSEVIELELYDSQKKYSESNLYIIAESKFSPSCQHSAIYLSDKVVGFLEYEYGESDIDKDYCTIWRFMIDKKYQGSGIGKAAFGLLLKTIKSHGRCNLVDIYYEPENIVAKKLYASYGFREVGERDDGTVIAEMNLSKY